MACAPPLRRDSQKCAQHTCRATVYVVRRGDRRSVARRQHPDVDAVVGAHVGRSDADPRRAQAGRTVPQRGAGLHVRRRQGSRSHDRTRGDRRLPRPRLPRTGTRRPGAAEGDDGVAGLRTGARRVRPDAARGDGTRRRRRTGAPARPTRGRVRTDTSWSSVAASRGCSQASGSRRPASRSPSSRRTPASAAPGMRTPTRAHGSTSEITSTATASNRATIGRGSSPSSPNFRPTSRACMDRHDIGRHVRWETEVTGARWDEATATWTVAHARPRRHRVHVDR